MFFRYISMRVVPLASADVAEENNQIYLIHETSISIFS
jgi:hypothetical protein